MNQNNTAQDTTYHIPCDSHHEIVYRTMDPDRSLVTLHTICDQVDGNYIGIIPAAQCEGEIAESSCISYESYLEKKNAVYMNFPVFDVTAETVWHVAWKCHGEIFTAPLLEKVSLPVAELCHVEWTEGEGLLLEVWTTTDTDPCPVLELSKCTEEEEEPETVYIAAETVEEEDGIRKIFFRLDTSVCFKEIGKWELAVCADEQESARRLVVDINKPRKLPGKIYDKNNTQTRISFSHSDGRLVLGREFSRSVLNPKNIQNCGAFLNGRTEMPLDEFLWEDVGPTGRMHAWFVPEEDGSVWIQPCQQMENIIEARLAMFHTQGYGILSVQPLEVTSGRLEKFKLEMPNIEQTGKLSKPMNSIWFRIGVALRTPEGIYYVLLRAFDLDTGGKRGPIYDIRDLYMDPIGEKTICQRPMLAVPYYGSNQLLSMKYVRPDYLYRSQFTNELLDVRIKHDILTVQMKCRDCGGEYKGVLLEYRKEKEDDEESYLIPYDSLIEEDGSFLMTTKIDLKKYYLRMLYWDIRCAFEKDGTLYSVSCHSTDTRLLKRYRHIFVDRCYPNDNSILFPYATSNHSVALRHRETCSQDHWRFRLKERIAMILYKAFKTHWDNRNIYLIFEKYCVMAQDNGFYFFQYCMDAGVEEDFDGKLYYVLDKKSADWEKVKPYKDHVLKYLSLRHLICLQACHLLISTDTKGHAYVWRSMDSDIKDASYKKSLVFLQHGVTAFKRGHFEKGTTVGCERFITTSQFEHDIIRNHFGYTEEEVPITGFARWDVLHDKSEGHREILMMPTWRTWLDDAENEVFAQSDYCINYMALLNDPRLDEILRANDVTLNFYLHPKFRKFITEFQVVSDRIRLISFGEEPLNELMMECNLLITDFSSVAWDVYYMKKPVLFYHFDMEYANQTLGFYMDMEHDLFGDRAESPEELMALLEEYVKNNFQVKSEYLENHNQYFAYIDDQNSERTWRKIREKEW